MSSDNDNPFDVLLTATQAAARLVASDAPLSRTARVELAALLRGLGGVLVEVEGAIAVLRRGRS